MKSRLLIILFASLIVSGLPGPVFGPPFFSDQDKYNSADVILAGEIVSHFKPEAPANLVSSVDTIYEVEVTQYIKNNLGHQTLHVITRGGPDFPQDAMGGSVNFKVGDLVYLYLQYDKTDSLRVQTLFSHVIAQPCDPVPADLEHLTGEPSAWEHRILNTMGEEQDVFSINEKIIIQKDIVNSRPHAVDYQVVFSIHAGPNEDDKTVFGPETLEFTLPACVGHTILEQEFMPTKTGDYLVSIRSLDRGTGFHFFVTEDGTPNPQYYDIPVDDRPILKQYNSGVPENELFCYDNDKTLAFKINGKPACLTPETLFKLLERGWVAPKQYVPMPDMEGPGGRHHSEIAFDGAQEFLESSPTFLFDGIGGSMGNKGYIQTDTILYLLDGQFTSRHPGYGDRTGQDLPEQETNHHTAFLIKDGVVEYAVMDNHWDMINHEFIYNFSDEYKDFELRYRNYQEDDFVESLQVESQPGILRVERPLFDEHYLLDPTDAEQLWMTIQENNFFEMENSFRCTGECNFYSLSVKSGGTYNEIQWTESNKISDNLKRIHSEIQRVISEQKNGFS